MRCFISHIHEEAPVAAALKRILESRVSDCEAWVSGVDVALGKQWLSEFDKAIAAADKVFVICSQQALQRPWIHFEAGVGMGRETDVLPVCHSNLNIDELPIPFSVLQSRNLHTIRQLQELLESFGGDTADLKPDWQDLEAACEQVDYVPLAVRPLRKPRSKRAILVDGAHGQRSWPDGRRGTIFERAESNFAKILGGAEMDVYFIEDADQIRASDMAPWPGLIMALPLHRRIASSKIDQIVEWVQGGGRLLLLGFELGDLHHKGNLNDVAGRFALRFHGDVVAPTGWKTGKPYDEDIAFAVDESQDLLEGIKHVVWHNVQSLAPEPGTYSQLTIGAGALAVPTPDSVRFADGLLHMPNPKFVTRHQADWLPVCAKATPLLTGKGGVLACGTWDLLPDTSKPNDNEQFVRNVLDWLTPE